MLTVCPQRPTIRNVDHTSTRFAGVGRSPAEVHIRALGADGYAVDLDPYALLGVARDATPRQIHEARKYADRVLGDISRGLGPDVAAAKSAEIERAWKLLSDPDERAAVDAHLRSAGSADPSAANGFTRSDGHPGKTCSVCHAAPAMTMHFRVRHSRRSVESVSGMFCRTCGIATFRDVTNQTLRQGFWRARTIITTMAIVQGNWRERRRIDVLKQSDDTSLSLDPGRPVWMRSGVVALTITLSVVTMSVAQVADIGSLLNTKSSPVNELPIP